jgi:serine/threonine protein kinase
MKTCPVCDTPYPNQHATCPTDGAMLIESRELAPGQIVRGKYRIVRKLGAGGMGVVYLAEHLLLGGQLALKFLAVELSRNPQFIKRFRQEARAAYQLRHPNIVEVVDLDQDEDGSLFIAMEFVSGPSLRSVLQEAPRGLPVERALHIARGLGAGLAAAHARGAVHRDIKPENILLGTMPDGSEQPKVLDFGIAAMAEGITNMSHTHGLLLTPEYASPEQWRGTPAAELDGRTDLYALGGVLYEMLAGRTPFHAQNMEGWMYQHLQGVPQPLERLRPSLAKEHPGLEAIVMRLLAREREQRFPSAAAFLEATAPQQQASAPQRPAPRPVTVVEKSPAPVSSPPSRSAVPKWVWAAALAVVGLGIFAGVWFWKSTPATAVPVLSPPKAAQPATNPGGTTSAAANSDYTQGKSAFDHKDYAKARTIFTQACNGDNMNACNYLGAIYYQGLGVKADDVMARKIYQKSCDHENMLGCNNLGTVLQNLGNNTEARKYFQKACEGKVAAACDQLNGAQ